MSKGKIIIIGSNVTQVEAKGDKAKAPTGQYLNETVIQRWRLSQQCSWAF
ncbi:MAG: hypothetical protein ACXU9U_02825 [Parachlamydiaceae bacterium]